MIPEDWDIKPLEEIAHKVMVGIASAATHAYSDFGVIMLRNLNIKENRIDESNLLFIDPGYELQHKNKRIKVGDVITVRTGYPGISAVVPEKFNSAQCFTSLITRPKAEVINSYFLCLYINSEYGRKFITESEAGGAQKNVNAGVLSKMPVPIPPMQEQHKIVEILSTWDKAIALLEQLITAKRKLKQGLMQQLLTGKKRFKEFEGSEWETYHFKEIFKRVTRKNTIGNSNILTISGNHGLINQRDFFNKRIAADNLDGYYLVKKGEFAYNKSYSNGYPLGAIKRLDRYEEGALSTLYICFRICNVSVNSDFLAHYFEAGILNKQIYEIAQEGARNHGLLNISVTDFFEILLRLPSLAEQQKIAYILSAADAEISTLEKQLAAYKQQKCGLMQQLLTGKKRVKIDEPQMQKV